MGCSGSKNALGQECATLALLGKGNTSGTCGEKKPIIKHQKKTSGHKPSFNDRALDDVYQPVRVLGSGYSGESWLVKDRKTGHFVALKLMRRAIPCAMRPMLIREIEIQSKLGEGHLNIVQSYDALLTDNHLAIAMEYAAGGGLDKYVGAHRPPSGQGLFLSEQQSLYFFRQIISAIEFFHSNNVAHRDIKLENTLLDNSDPPYIKICDFGFAKSWGGIVDSSQAANPSDERFFTQLGTPVYMSPEMIRASKLGYAPKAADIWSAGVLLFVMLMGSFPFDYGSELECTMSPEEKVAHLYELQTNGHWSDRPSNVRGLYQLSSKARNLLDKLLEVNPSKRITLKEIKEHPWFTQPLQSPKHQAALDALQAAQDLIPQYNLSTIDPIKYADRHMVLERMVATATSPAGTSAPPSLPRELGIGRPFLCRVNLQHSAIGYDGPCNIVSSMVAHLSWTVNCKIISPAAESIRRQARLHPFKQHCNPPESEDRDK